MLQKIRRRISLVGLFAATFAWGASFFLVKKATSQVGIWPFLFYRFGLACALLALLMPKKLFRANKTLINRGAILGALLFLAIWSQTQGIIDQGSWSLASWPSFALGSVIFNAVFTTCFGFIMQIVGQKAIGSLKAALIFALEAPFSSGFASIFLGETMSHNEAAGALLVFLTSIIPEPWLKKSKGETK